MTAHVTVSDLKMLDSEPRVQDLTLAGALEFAQTRDIRKLIERNRSELARHGEVCATVAQTSPNGGRPGNEYWLNEPQSLLICMFSRTDKAAEVRAEIIDVFMKWRRGQHPDPAAPIPSTADSIAGEPLAVVTAKLGIVREARLIHGPDRARALWDRLGLPAVPGGNELAVADARACLAHLVAAVAAEAPLRLMLRAAFNDDADAIARLREVGLRVMEDEDGVAIGNNHPRVAEAFRNSPWSEGRHVAALRALPGARKLGPVKFSSQTAHRALFVPLEAVEAAVP